MINSSFFNDDSLMKQDFQSIDCDNNEEAGKHFSKKISKSQDELNDFNNSKSKLKKNSKKKRP
jgi:hypothetical protein